MAFTKTDKQTSDIFDKNRVKYLRQISEIRRTQKTDLKREHRWPYTVWTEDQVEQLTELWPTDLPVSEIAGKLGVTTNAVTSKAKRLSLRRLGLAMRRDPAMKHQYLFR
jgi:hypothetical protein